MTVNALLQSGGIQEEQTLSFLSSQPFSTLSSLPARNMAPIL